MTCYLKIALALILFAAPAPAQSPTNIDPTALVRRAIQHRLDAQKTHHPLRYLLHVHDQSHDTTKDIVETKDSNVARLIATYGKPLTPEANQAELDRLDNLAAHPDLQAHRFKSEQKDQARVDRLMAELPDALLYHLQALEPCPTGHCYRLSFTPNPQWTPPDLESRIFRATSGEVWIDQSQERLTRLEAHFIADTDFGFGLLGRINKGGAILLEQTDIGNHDWQLTSLRVNATGRALLVKSLDFEIVEDASHFSQVPPNLTYRDAIQLLKSPNPAKLLAPAP